LKLNSDKLDDGLFPRRKPWLIILIVAAVAGYPAYRLGLLAANRNSTGTGKSVVAAPASKETAVRVIASPVQASVVPQSPAAAVPVQVKRSNDTVVARAVPAVMPPMVVESSTGLVDTAQSESQRSVLEERLGSDNIEQLLSRKKSPWKVDYVVKPNDAVEKIARKNKTTSELIARMNGLGTGHTIRSGQTLKVLNGRFTIAISKSKFELVLELDGKFFKRYGVCVGAQSKTPPGVYVVTSREVNPTWWPEGKGPIPAGDERNLLGTRWMAIKDPKNPAEDRRGLGIHGTRDDTSIGKPVSAGCIRMRNSDVEEIHMLIPIGTPVTIAE